MELILTILGNDRFYYLYNATIIIAFFKKMLIALILLYDILRNLFIERYMKNLNNSNE